MPPIILVVDTHYRRHSGLLRSIIEAGFELALVEDDQAAIDWLERNTPDVMVCDATRYSATRLSMLEQFRTLTGASKVPVFIEDDVPNTHRPGDDRYPDGQTFSFDSHAVQSLVAHISVMLR